MKRTSIFAVILCGMILLAGAGSGIFLGTQNHWKMDAELLSVTAQKATCQPLEENAANAVARFSMELLKASHEKGENTFLSPLSVYFALGLTSNGADTNTLEQLETLLGGKRGTLPSINNTCRALIENLPSDEKGKKVRLANSVWFRKDHLEVYDSFLEANAAFYDAQIYRADYNDPESVSRDMNHWVENKTDGLIEEIISPNEITADSMLTLYNTIYFNCEWASEISKSQVYPELFTCQDGTEISMPFLHGTGVYLEEEGLYTGFRKAYQGHYAFVGLLPEEGSTPEQLAEAITVEAVRSLAGSDHGDAIAAFPEWKMEDEFSFERALINMGLDNFFVRTDPDLSRMGISTMGKLEVAQVLQRAVLDVNRKGTKAAAVTKVDVTASAAESSSVEPIPVILDRPFLFFILDTDSGLPLFTGIVNYFR